MHQIKDICHQYYVVTGNKRSHDTEKYFGIAKSPFVNLIQVRDLAKTKVLDLSP